MTGRAGRLPFLDRYLTLTGLQSGRLIAVAMALAIRSALPGLTTEKVGPLRLQKLLDQPQHRQPYKLARKLPRITGRLLPVHECAELLAHPFGCRYSVHGVRLLSAGLPAVYTLGAYAFSLPTQHRASPKLQEV